MTFRATLGQLRPSLVWLIYALTCLWLALAIAWWLSARFDYAYPFWYSVLAIDEHIDEYAPQNPQKRGFAQLSPERHQRAFAQISAAVHDGGRGLEAIRYPGPDGRPVRLLNRDEINHLRDVAHLLERLTLVSAGMALLWLPLGLMGRYLGLPSRRTRLIAAGVLALAVTLPLAVAGPEAVFNAVHEWIFPPEHPWFFYWQESLMSTLMKAPVLFGGLAAQIGALGLVLVPVLHALGLRTGQRLLRVLRSDHAH